MTKHWRLLATAAALMALHALYSVWVSRGLAGLIGLLGLAALAYGAYIVLYRTPSRAWADVAPEGGKDDVDLAA